MKRIALFAAALFAGTAFLLTGCGKDATIDGSSLEAYETSYAEVTKEMSPSKKAQLDEALAKIAKRRSRSSMAQELFLVDISDLTADEIIEKAATIK